MKRGLSVEAGFSRNGEDSSSHGETLRQDETAIKTKSDRVKSTPGLKQIVINHAGRENLVMKLTSWTPFPSERGALYNST